MDDSSNTAAPSPAAAQPSRRRRCRWPWWVAGGVIAAPLLLMAAAVLWLGSASSLKQALALAQRLLPEGQVLEFAQAEGSIARGGRIGLLEWRGEGIALRIEALTLDWHLADLLHDGFDVRTLRIGRLHLRLAPRDEPPPRQPFAMPQQLTLPIRRVAMNLLVGRIEIESVDAQGGSTVQVLEDLAARYRYDDLRHMLVLDSLTYGRSRMQASLALGARDLGLEARVAASLRDWVPGVPLAMLAHASASGTLAGGEAARLELELHAREQDREAPAPDPARLLEQLATLRATPEQQGPAALPPARFFLRATAHPWRAQPFETLELRVSRLNAAAFHAAAPHTVIGAQAEVTPVEDGTRAWTARLTLRNDAAGPWNQGFAPLQSLDLRARLTPAQADIEAAHAVLGGDPPATIDLVGILPWTAPASARASLELRQVDLKLLLDSWPRTRLDGAFLLAPLEGGGAEGAQPGWQAVGELTNALAGRLDRQLLPLARFTGRLEATSSRWQAHDVVLVIGDGSLRVQGRYMPAARTLDVRGTLARLPPAAIHRNLAADTASRLSGTFSVAGPLGGQVRFAADIGEEGRPATGNGSAVRSEWEIRTVRLAGEWSPRRLRVRELDVDAMGARLAGRNIDVALPDLASIEAQLFAEAPGLALQADAAMRDHAGGGTLSLVLSSAPQTLAWLRGLPMVGQSIPAIEASGGATLSVGWQGGWRQWLEGLADPRRHPHLSIDARLTSERLHLELPADSAFDALEAQAFDVSLRGNLAAASLLATGSLRAGETSAVLDLRMSMQRDAAETPLPGWRLLFERMQVEATLPGQPGRWHLALDDGLTVNLSTGQEFALQSTAGGLSLIPPAELDTGRRPLRIAWQPLQFRRAVGAVRLASRGTIEGIQPAWLDALPDGTGAGRLRGMGLGTNLVLGAQWRVVLADTLEVHVRVAREQGDLWLLGNGGRSSAAGPPPDAIAAGLRAFAIRVDSSGEDLTLAADWESDRAGVIHVAAATRLSRSADGWSLPREAPLAGRLDARLQDLAMWSLIAPPGWRVQGRLTADIAIEGTWDAPLLRGAIDGERLNLRSVLEGVELHDGLLAARLDGRRLLVDRLEFQGGTGSRAYIAGLSGNRTPAPTERGGMIARGVVDWSDVGRAGSGTGIAMDFIARLQRMQVLVRNDRQLTLDGELSAALEEGTLRVRGDLDVIRATVLLPDAGAATLGDDVIVVRNDEALELIEVGRIGGGRGRLEAARPIDLQIRLDLGRDLALHGYGITTRLQGELTLQSSARPDRPFSLFGEVHTDQGRYRAWGQSLDVETGEIAFSGDPDNPSLNLLAIRPEIPVRAGVRVTGTLRAPQVRLYSEPPLPEAEKLSWVVLGRPTAIGGSEGTSMQRAALGLLAGSAASSLAGGIGVDELQLGESTVSVGKRITDQLYVTYEAGLSGPASTLYIFYDITRRLTLRGESGEATAVDLIYTFDFD